MKKPRPKPKKKPPTGSIGAALSAPPSDVAPTITALPRTAVTTVIQEPTPPFEFYPQIHHPPSQTGPNRAFETLNRSSLLKLS